jgi:hypothetical protein
MLNPAFSTHQNRGKPMNKPEMTSALRQIIGSEGVNIIADKPRFKALLGDFLPEYKYRAEQRALLTAVDADDWKILIEVHGKGKAEHERAMKVLLRQLQEDFGWAKETCVLVLECYTAAMGWNDVDVGSIAGLGVQTVPVPPVQPVPPPPVPPLPPLPPQYVQLQPLQTLPKRAGFMIGYFVCAFLLTMVWGNFGIFTYIMPYFVLNFGYNFRIVICLISFAVLIVLKIIETQKFKHVMSKKQQWEIFLRELVYGNTIILGAFCISILLRLYFTIVYILVFVLISTALIVLNIINSKAHKKQKDIDSLIKTDVVCASILTVLTILLALNVF